MTLQGGDREFGHGDQITVVLDPALSNDQAAGTAVRVNGRASTEDHVTVTPTADGEDSDAVLADAASPGDPIQAVMHGIVWALATGVSAGDTVGEAADGALDDTTESDYTVLEGSRTDKDGNDVALIRYEN
jgi:hypothetical protein